MQNITLVGNLTADPVLRESGDGSKRATFAIAINTGDKEKGNEKTLYADCTAFAQRGENVVNSLRKGQRVIVVGRLNQYQSEVQIKGEDKKITRTAFDVSAVGPDLSWATASVTKNERNDAPAPAARAAQAAPAAAPVAAAAAASDDF